MTTNKPHSETLSENIENIRKVRGTTKRHLYTAANIAQSTFDSRLSGETEFKFIEVVRIAEALGVTVSELASTGHASEQAA